MLSRPEERVEHSGIDMDRKWLGLGIFAAQGQPTNRRGGQPRSFAGF
jgi:hypothetical protein